MRSLQAIALFSLLCAPLAAVDQPPSVDVETLRSVFQTAEGKDKVEVASELLVVDPESVPKMLDFLVEVFRSSRSGPYYFSSAIRRGAKNAVPEMIRRAMSDDGTMRYMVGPALREHYAFTRAPLEELLKAKSVETRIRAVELLNRTYNAQPSIPALKELLRDEEEAVRCDAGLAIVDLNRDLAKSVMPTLTEVFRSCEPERQRRIVDVTSRRGVPLSACKQVLLMAVEDDDHVVRVRAALRLIGTGLISNMQLVPILRRELTAEGKYDQSIAMEALGRIGPAASETVPDLKQVLADYPDDDYYHHEALLAIALIDQSEVKSMLPKMLKVFAEWNGYSSQRLSYIRGFVKLGPVAESAVPIMRKMLTAKKEPLRVSLAVALLKLDPANPDAALGAIRGYFSGELRSHVPYNEFEGLGDVAQPLLPDLVRVLSATEHPRRSKAIDLLRGIGPAGEKVLREHGL